MEIELNQSDVRTHVRYAIDPQAPQKITVTLDERRYWGLLQVTNRTSKAPQQAISEALDDYLRKWDIDTGMAQPRPTWRTRLAWWLIRTGRR